MTSESGAVKFLARQYTDLFKGIYAVSSSSVQCRCSGQLKKTDPACHPDEAGIVATRMEPGTQFSCTALDSHMGRNEPSGATVHRLDLQTRTLSLSSCLLICPAPS